MTRDIAETSNYEKAISEWRVVLGKDYVNGTVETREKYSRTTLPQGTLPAIVLRPGTVAEVQDVVRIAARYRTPLYPISRGKNWGLGDACAVSDGQAIVDLGRLNRIQEVNVPMAYAVVEPGVTQQQLYDYLRKHDYPLWLDATGAGPESSVVGNIMERGYGHTPIGDRFHNSFGYEIVLADGRLLKAGFGHYSSSQVTNVFKTGIGPSLDGLFTQSNLGIVTRLAVALMPQPPCFEAFAFKVAREDQIDAVIEALRPLRLMQVLQSTIHIANDLRVLSAHQTYPWNEASGRTPLPASLREELRKKRGLGAWNVLGGLYGTRETVRATKKTLAAALRHLTRPIFITDRKLHAADAALAAGRLIGVGGKLREMIASIRPAYALLKGEPVADHLAGTAWRSSMPWSKDMPDPLDRGDGLIWLTPVTPITGAAARDLLDLVGPIFTRYEFEPLLTFVMMSSRAMCCPMTVCYDRHNGDEVRRAAQCYEALWNAVMNRGYPPYRAGILAMPKLDEGSSVFWDVVRGIKGALDPAGILAPGRYLPDET